MIQLTLPQVAAAVSGLLMDADQDLPQVVGVSTDSRTIAPGNLFVALRGERHDGHQYLDAAREAGAVAVMVDHRCHSGLPEIIVEDTLIALGHLARCWRDEVDPLVIAVTGSAGKTTVKQLLAAIFAQAGPTLATEGNLNNEIGVPLTLCRLERTHRYAVIEMGANHSGEIARLCAITRPDIAMVTFAGRAHLGEFGGMDAIVRAKGEIYEHLGPAGTAVINLGSAGSDYWQRVNTAGRSWTFSLDAPAIGADVKGRYWLDAQGQGWLDVNTATAKLSLPVPLPGRHNGLNLLAAVTAALAAGIAPALIEQGLKHFQAPKGRLAVTQISDALSVIDDSYNANPESMMAAVDVLVTRPGRHWLVMGDMGELGEDAATLHAEIGRYARQRGVERLLAVGEHSGEAAASFGEGGAHFGSISELQSALNQQVNENKREPLTILVKGSRFMRMEQIVESLQMHVTVMASAERVGEAH